MLVELGISLCSEELNDQCRMLTTSKITAGISFQDVNWLVVVLLSMSSYLHSGYHCTALRFAFTSEPHPQCRSQNSPRPRPAFLALYAPGHGLGSPGPAYAPAHPHVNWY